MTQKLSRERRSVHRRAFSSRRDGDADARMPRADLPFGSLHSLGVCGSRNFDVSLREAASLLSKRVEENVAAPRCTAALCDSRKKECFKGVLRIKE